MNWSKMKEKIEDQMNADPQRATLATKAWQGVEAGLQHLHSVGYQFEIAPRGTLAENTELKLDKPVTMPLSMEDAVGQITGGPKSIQISPFEAKTELN